MPPCKGHRKSRNGCLTCKRRRVKCDEMRPRCTNCTKRGVMGATCVYPNGQDVDGARLSNDREQSSSASKHIPASGHCVCICGRDQAHTHSPGISLEFPGALPACFLFNLKPAHSSSRRNGPQEIPCISLIDLSLLHHFTVYTAKAMTISALQTDNDECKTWSEVVPKMGQSYPFVMHAILAAAAAHVNTEESMEIGEYHYGAALIGIQKELEGNNSHEVQSAMMTITEHNCHALFIAINLSNLYALSASRCRYLLEKNNNDSNLMLTTLQNGEFGPQESPQLGRLDTTWTSITRSSLGVLAQSWKWIMAGPVASIFLPYMAPTPKAMPTILSKRTDEMLKELIRLCSDCSLDGAAEELGEIQIATAYFAAIGNLRKVWGVLEDYAYVSSTRKCNQLLSKQRSHAFLNEKPAAAALYSTIFQFVQRTPATFWECLDKKKPRALVIYAYFVACFEALNFGCDSSGAHGRSNCTLGTGTSTRSSETTPAWWILGRAESDLRCVENELCTLGVIGTWREWVAGAWRIREGLRKGWWFDNDNQLDITAADVDGLAPLDPFDYTTNYSEITEHLDEHQWITGFLEEQQGPTSLQIGLESFVVGNSAQEHAIDFTDTNDGPYL